MQDQGDRQAGLLAATESGGGGYRRDQRRRTLKQARVVLSEWTTIDCRLRDISDSGAHIVFSNAVRLPETFRLHNVSDGTITPVELKWQRGLEAGVAFTGPAEPLSGLKR